MRWFWVLAVVLTSTAGDVFSAKGMAERGEMQDFRPRAVADVMRYMISHRVVLAGILSNAVSFIAFMELLAVAQLSFAVPATGMAYIVKAVLAKFYLHEDVTVPRWIGVALVASGIVLIAI